MALLFFPGFVALLAVFFTTVNASIREAKDEEFPFQVSIQTLDRRHLCGGAIITPKWVLSTKACLENQRTVMVAYGSIDSNNHNMIKSFSIVPQKEFNLNRKNSLALVELENPIEFTKKVKNAGLPTEKAELRNNTKMSGWKVSRQVNVPPNLYVSDEYYVIPTDCKTVTGMPVHLGVDEFCGMDEDQTTALFNQGTIVSKAAVVLGILATEPLTMHQPTIFVKVSEHEQWIRSVLRGDAEHVHWVDVVPNYSVPSSSFVSVALIGISAIFLRFF